MTNMVLLQIAAVAALHWDVQVSNTMASLRGLRVVSPQIVWASGTKGTFLRTTDGGAHWQSGTVAGAEALDFRDVEAVDAETAFLLASGEGANSRVYKTTDAGVHWELLMTNPDAKGFFDALAFWDAKHAMLLGDPVDGHFVVYTTADAGKTWQRRQTPSAMEGEGAFAASGTSLVTQGSKVAWFATGGPAGGRVFKTRDGGRSWSVSNVPMGGVKTAGIFSLTFVDKKHGIAVGGDYQNPKAAEHTVALTRDGGKTWQSAAGLGYRSCVAAKGGRKLVAVGTSGSDVSDDGGQTWRHFSDTSVNAVAGNGGAVWAVGPKGVILKLAAEH
jgi:photosystem II stability/assembly factor-like uncharacterized protein